MGDRIRVRLPEPALYFGMYPTTQVDTAFHPPWTVNEYQTKGGDALRLESKAGMV